MHTINKILTLAVLLSWHTIKVNAQAVAPTSNIPDNTSQPAPTPVSVYPGLIDYSNITNRNYTRVFIPQVPATNEGDITLPNLNTVNPAIPSLVTTSYTDGISRPLQEVMRMGNASNAQDMVSVHTYDNNGREANGYLPYGASDNITNRGKLRVLPFTELKGAYNYAYMGEQPYTQSEFDNSPLNRIMKEMAPGKSWVGSGRGTTYIYGTNTNSQEDKILNYTIGITGINYTTGTIQDLPVSAGLYAAGTLTKTKITDADGKWVYKYADKQGRTIAVQRYVDYSGIAQQYWPQYYNITYYVYDDMGNLRFVISPEAYKQSNAAGVGGVITQQIADGLCYQYFYDDRGRLIAKKLPGKYTEFMVYDKKDRLVLTQEGNLGPDVGKWKFMIYDVLNRPVVTGIYSNTANQAQLANILSDATSYTSPDLLYYLKQASLINNYPSTITDCEILGYTYYDDYVNLGNASFNGSFNSKLTGQLPYAGVPMQAASVRGLVTGNKVKVMDPASGVQWITTTNFYDDKGRLIQTQSNNIKGGTDIITNQYDFAGTLISSVIDHNNPQAVSWNMSIPGMYQHEQIVKRYTKNYQNGAITKLEQNINNVGWRPVSTIGFDDFNRVKNKNQGGAADNYYDYNIQGSLTGINAAFIDAVNPTNKYFFETLSYDKGFTSKLYNGDIAGITWKGAGTGANKRSYGYTYDGLDRLQHAEYNEWVQSGGSYNWNKSQTDYTASGITYDYNGNIKTMNQRGPGFLNGNPGIVDMDKLSYNYAANSNQLLGVAESNNGVTTTGPDFKDGNTSGNDYSYDANGNLLVDKNKGINTSISYSYQDKPTHIVVTNKGTIDYIYDAAGTKLQKKVYDQSTGLTTTTDYIGEFVYENNKLQYILNEEGRCRPQITNNTSPVPVFEYDYFVKDHVQNVRTTINAQPAGLGPQVQYNAGMELSMANTESLVWSHLDDVRSGKPGSIEVADTKAAELNGADPDKRIGVAIMLKAMPGDRFDLSAQTYYDAFGDDQVASPEDIAGSLIHALSGGTNYSGVPIDELPENMRTIENTIGNPGFAGAYDALTSDNYDNTKPAAYLNYVVFDENMRVVKENSGVLQMGGNGGQWNTLATDGQITINQPGYIAVFASSRIGTPVFFDKIDLTYYKGTVLDENHYYPFGLTLSTQTPNANEKNNYKLTTKELQDNFGLNWYDFGARMQDEQIGRWTSIDPLAENALGWTPYRYAFDNPVSFTDPNGMAELAGILVKAERFPCPSVNYGLSFVNVPSIGDVQLSRPPSPPVSSAPPISNPGTNVEPNPSPNFRGWGFRSAVLLYVWELFVSHNDDETPVQIYNKTQKPEDAPGYTEGFANEMERQGYVRPRPPVGYKPEGRDDEYITLYRGVGDGNGKDEALLVQYNAATGGVALPLGLVKNDKNTHNDPEFHTTGSNNTFYTSWTTKYGFAKYAALYKSNNGVIISAVFRKSDLIRSRLSLTSGYAIEAEYLYFGVKIGAPQKVKR